MAIYYKPQEVPELFYKSVVNTMQSVLLADDKENEINVLMYDDFGYPTLLVTCDGYAIDTVSCLEPLEICDNVAEVYNSYIDCNFDDGIEDDVDSHNAIIMEREQELEDAAIDFLSVVLEKNIVQTGHEASGYLSAFVDEVMELLYRKHKVDAFRPMILVDENDQEFYEEYPYSSMDFDD